VRDDELGELAFADIEDVADDPQVPAAYRRRVGVAMVVEAWQRAVAQAQDGGRDG
jgi:carbon-monoxide dehydrogenase medium subunit